MGTTNLDSLTLSGTLTAASVVGPIAGAVAGTTGAFSSTLSLAAGLVGTPSLTFTGDTDTGIYHSAANTLVIVTNGAAVLTADASGVNGVIGATTPALATFTAVTGTYFTASQYFDESTTDAISAAGTTRADATALTTAINNVTTAAASTGVVLPPSATVGVGGHVIIYNNGASAIKVYAAGSDTIDGTAGATGVTLTNALRCEYRVTASGKFLSAKLGATST